MTTPSEKRLVPGVLVDGKYEIIAEIGEGGMGFVYEAFHHFLGKRVAIKLLRAGLDSVELCQRFEHEARVAAQLRSPYVARVFDVGVTPDGAHYMVMELLEGKDLAATLRKGEELSMTDAVDILLEISCALAEAHARGLVHRDIKPSNVFLSQEGEFRVAKLLDFGISLSAMSDEHLEPSDRTFGTPQYMSPEQVACPSGVDARSDLWSLGVLAYRMLTRRYPFSARSSQIPNHREPIPHLNSVRADLPFELANAIMRCLENDPARRPQSAREFALMIWDFGSGEVPVRRSLRVAEALRNSESGAHSGRFAALVAPPSSRPPVAVATVPLLPVPEPYPSDRPNLAFASSQRETIPAPKAHVVVPSSPVEPRETEVPLRTWATLATYAAVACGSLVALAGYFGFVEAPTLPSVAVAANVGAPDASPVELSTARTFEEGKRPTFHVRRIGRNVIWMAGEEVSELELAMKDVDVPDASR